MSERQKQIFPGHDDFCMFFHGEHITDTYVTETDTTELKNLSHNIIDTFIIETEHN